MEHDEQALQKLQEELDADAAALRQLGEEELPELALQELRHRVMSQIPARRRKSYWIPVAIAAAVMAVMFAWWPRPVEVPAPAAARRADQPMPVAPTPERERPLVAVAKRIDRRAAPPARLPEQLMVKLETPDPNVVIYWMVESKEGSE